MASKIWKLKDRYPDNLDEELKRYPRLFRQVLYNRGLTTVKDVEHFLNPSFADDVFDPFLFKEMLKAVEIISKAIKQNKKITVYGDYDADGVCGTAILAKVLTELKANFDIYLPHRQDEGYGLNRRAIERIAQSGTSLIVTVDSGISNIEEIGHAGSLGMRVIITDHHQQLHERPNAVAILHPTLEGETYPDKRLCGGGVAFKLAQALIERNKDAFLDGFDKWLLDLVAISTIADYGELISENRALVKYGLIVLNKTRNTGLKTLLNLIRISDKPLDSVQVAMRIIPLINAAGRMDHANTAYQLLVSDEEKQAKRLVKSLQEANTKRQLLTDEIYKSALKQVAKQSDEKLLVAYDESWPITLMGIVASKLVNEFNKPVAVIGRKKDRWAGSVRSIPIFNIVEALKKISSCLENYGGHSQAAGFTLSEKSDLKNFIMSYQKCANDALETEELKPTLEIDSEIALADIKEDLVDWMEKLQPFGQKKNPKPRFLLKRAVLKECHVLGKNGNHLKLMVMKPGGDGHIKFVFFGAAASWFGCLKQEAVFDAVIELSYNNWQGLNEIQVKVIDMKLAA